MNYKVESADQYLRSHRIMELFEDLATRASFMQPENLEEFIASDLKIRQKQGFMVGLFTQAEVKNVFELFDLKKDGYISRDNCKRALLTMAASAKQQEIIDQTDRKEWIQVDFSDYLSNIWGCDYYYIIYVMTDENIQRAYILNLQNECKRILCTNDLRILEFLYKTVYNKEYFQLTKYDPEKIEKLNILIGSTILYPIHDLLLSNTQQALTLIPGFINFYMGANMNISNIIRTNSDSLWDAFLTACAYNIQGDLIKYEHFMLKFHTMISLSNMNYLALDADQSAKKLHSILEPVKLLQMLNQFFYSDCFPFCILAKNEPSSYLQFLVDRKCQSFLNSFVYIQERFQINDIIYDQIILLKLKIAQAFIKRDYSLPYINLQIDLYVVGMIIYSLIQLDHKQFVSFLAILSESEKEQQLIQIRHHVIDINTDFHKLILVAKSLKKIGEWEKSKAIIEKLVKEQPKCTNKSKYLPYLYSFLGKISMFLIDIKTAYQYTKMAINKIEELSKSQKSEQLQYFQSNQDLLGQLRNRMLLLSYYMDDMRVTLNYLIILQQDMQQSDQQNQRRKCTSIQQRFMECIYNDKTNSIIQQLNAKRNGIKDFGKIVKQIQINLIIRSSHTVSNWPVSTQININGVTELIESLLILHILLQTRDYVEVYYVQVRYYKFIYLLMKQTNLYNNSMKAHIYKYLSYYDDSIQVADLQTDQKLVAEIYELKGDYTKALQYYKNVLDIDCYFHIGNIYRLQGQFREAYDSYSRLANLSTTYKSLSFKLMHKVQMEDEVESYQKTRLSRQANDFSYLNDETNVGIKRGFTAQIQDIHLPPCPIRQSVTGVFIVESFLDEDIDDTKSSQQQEEQVEKLQFPLQDFDFKVREDVALLYQDCQQFIPKYPELDQLLREFVVATKQYQVESDELNKMTIQRLIDRGGYSKVNQVSFQGQIYASKISQITFKDNNLSFQAAKELQYRLKELIILSFLREQQIPYVLKCQHIGFMFIASRDRQTKTIKIYNLNPIYKESSTIRQWPNQQKFWFCLKLVHSLNQLHLLRIIHRDIKPQNILVTDDGDPVIIDFGLAQDNYQSNINGSGVFTQRYAAPEYQRDNQKSSKNDVYSFGLILYYYYTNESPYEGINEHILPDFITFRRHIILLNDRQLVPEFIHMLIKKCTMPIESRLSFQKVLFLYLQELCKPTRPDVQFLIECLATDFNEEAITEQQIKIVKEFSDICLQYQLESINLTGIETQRELTQNISEVIFMGQQYLMECRLITYKGNNQKQAFNYLLSIIRMIRNIYRLNQHNVKCILQLVHLGFEFVNTIATNTKSIRFILLYKHQELIKLQVQDNYHKLIPKLANCINEVHSSNIILLHYSSDTIMQCQDQLIFIQLLSSRCADERYENDLGYYNDRVDPLLYKSNLFGYYNDIYCLGQFIHQFIIRNNIKHTKRQLKQLNTIVKNTTKLNDKQRWSLNTIIEYLDKQ